MSEEESLNPSSRHLVGKKKPKTREDFLQEELYEVKRKFEDIWEYSIQRERTYVKYQDLMFFISILMLIIGLLIGICIGKVILIG